MSAVPGSGAVASVFAGNAGKAAPILAGLAAGRRDEKLSGAYLNKAVVDTPSRAARESEAQERLWEWSTSAVGLSAAGAGRMAGEG